MESWRSRLERMRLSYLGEKEKLGFKWSINEDIVDKVVKELAGDEAPGRMVSC